MNDIDFSSFLTGDVGFTGDTVSLEGDFSYVPPTSTFGSAFTSYNSSANYGFAGSEGYEDIANFEPLDFSSLYSEPDASAGFSLSLSSEGGAFSETDFTFSDNDVSFSSDLTLSELINLNTPTGSGALSFQNSSGLSSLDDYSFGDDSSPLNPFSTPVPTISRDPAASDVSTVIPDDILESIPDLGNPIILASASNDLDGLLAPVGGETEETAILTDGTIVQTPEADTLFASSAGGLFSSDTVEYSISESNSTINALDAAETEAILSTPFNSDEPLGPIGIVEGDIDAFDVPEENGSDITPSEEFLETQEVLSNTNSGTLDIQSSDLFEQAWRSESPEALADHLASYVDAQGSPEVNNPNPNAAVILLIAAYSDAQIELHPGAAQVPTVEKFGEALSILADRGDLNADLLVQAAQSNSSLIDTDTLEVLINETGNTALIEGYSDALGIETVTDGTSGEVLLVLEEGRFIPSPPDWRPPGDPAAFFREQAGDFADQITIGNNSLSVPYNTIQPESSDIEAAEVLRDVANLAAITNLGGQGLAADFLAHYFNGTNEPYQLDNAIGNQISAELTDPALLTQTTSDQINTDLNNHFDVFRGNNTNIPQSGTLRGVTESQLFDTARLQDSSISNALGRVEVQFVYEATWTTRSDGTRVVNVSGQPIIADTYDFAPNGLGTGIPSFVSDRFPQQIQNEFPELNRGVLPDSLLAHLQERGLAGPFSVIGTGDRVDIPFLFEENR